MGCGDLESGVDQRSRRVNPEVVHTEAMIGEHDDIRPVGEPELLQPCRRQPEVAVTAGEGLASLR